MGKVGKIFRQELLYHAQSMKVKGVALWVNYIDERAIAFWVWLVEPIAEKWRCAMLRRVRDIALASLG